MSIWCLLSEFYGLCSMRTFVLFILIPAMLLLTIMALLDRSRGDHRLARAVLIGSIAGLIAAFTYDLFRAERDATIAPSVEGWKLIAAPPLRRTPATSSAPLSRGC
jgi:hypothetical protein